MLLMVKMCLETYIYHIYFPFTGGPKNGLETRFNMMVKWLTSLVGLALLVTLSSADVFTSLADLVHVINTERMVLEAIKTYIRGEEYRLDYIKK